MTSTSAIRHAWGVVLAYLAVATVWTIAWHHDWAQPDALKPWLDRYHATADWTFVVASVAVLILALTLLNRRRYHVVFDSLGEGFAYVRVIVDRGRPVDLLYRDVNRPYCDLLGITGNPVGRRAIEMSPQIQSFLADGLERCARVAATGVLERHEVHIGTTGRWLAVTISRPARGHCLAVVEDITARKLADRQLEDARALLEIQVSQMRVLQDQLRERALQDPVMHIHNRSFLEEMLPLEVDRARRRQDSVGVLLLDIDHFKQINDSHGHAFGDAMLQSVARTLTASLRAGDVVCRYGGDEILCLLPGASRVATLERAQDLRAAIAAARVDHSHVSIRVTVSIGAAVFPEHGEEIEQVLRAADEALYQAKAAGRDCVHMAPAGAQLHLELTPSSAAAAQKR